tara:strand:- start:1417 stop:2532 length:1116 start_codon:yes stop_codon:yes gene_type:complete
VKAVFSYLVVFVFFGLVAPNTLAADAVKLGMSAPFSGPTKHLGQATREGAQAYFNKYNATPEGKQTPIELITYDDGYEPHNTYKNTLKLIQEDKVFALFNYVGTPTSKAILPLVKRYNIPYLFPYTGAEFLRWPVVDQVYNFRGSYYQEAETLVNYFVKKHRIKKAGLFIQSDAFGIEASRGYVKALNRKWITNTFQVRYRRNSEDIAHAIEQMKAQKPDVIFAVGTYQPVSQLVNELRRDNINTPVATLSFSGAEALRTHLENFEQIYISTVFPNPKASDLPVIQEYREDMAGHELSHESLEGYLNAKLFTEMIKKSKKPITHESFIISTESHLFDLGGLALRYSAENHSTLLPITLNKVTKEAIVEIKD